MRQETGQLRHPHPMQLHQAPADLLGQFRRPLLGRVFDLDLHKQIRARHNPNDTIENSGRCGGALRSRNPAMSSCELCETRRARRACPGIRGQICSVCCGTEREATVNCPLDCEYLQEARRHERLPEPESDKLPSPDISISDQFLTDNDGLITLAAGALVRAALETPGAVDSDVREALDSLVRTFRTLESGLYYESLPANPLAAGIHRAVRQGLEDARRRLRERTGATPFRDADILGVLVFFQRLGFYNNNGRTRGRAFIDFLRSRLPAPAQPSAGPSSLIIR